MFSDHICAQLRWHRYLGLAGDLRYEKDKSVEGGLTSVGQQASRLPVFSDVGDHLLLEGVDDLGVGHAGIETVDLLLIHRYETCLRGYVLIGFLVKKKSFH